MKGLRGTERVGRDRDMDIERRFGGSEVVMGRAAGFESGVARARGCRMCLCLG